MTQTLSRAQARRIALAAQGFGAARPTAAINQGHLSRVADRLKLFQIDSVSVVQRAHYLPLFSRLGAYPTRLLDQAAWGKPRRLFEYWAHEASLLPLSLHPLLRWRMARAERGQGTWQRMAAFAHERRPEADALLRRITSDGPLAASDLADQPGRKGWWEWSEPKVALEWLFWSGQITAATRRPSFERVYDLPERVLPRSVLDQPTPAEPDAHRALLAHAAQALGVATAADLRDYFRQKPDDAHPRLAELVENGTLLPVTVEGWSQPAYLHRDATLPRWVRGQALLAPFDPLIWHRPRAERLFDLHYRIEIYTPAEKRVHGYYVLPFLLDGVIVARVDLKADRAAGQLLVQSAHAEPDVPVETAERLAAELRLMAGWLGLTDVVVRPSGDLAAALAVTPGLTRGPASHLAALRSGIRRGAREDGRRT